jgi:hypothetical protein
MAVKVILQVYLCLLCIQFSSSWNQWIYSTTWSSFGADDALAKSTVWNSTWFNRLYKGNDSAPLPRKGHSLHIIKTDERSDYGGATYIVMFGGRGSDQTAVHIPRTYDVESVSVDFSSFG